MIAPVPREPANSRRRSHPAPTRLLALAVVALVTNAAAKAEAAQLVEVRVGRHPEFVRVVFETDAQATFAIAPGATPGETLVRLDAELAPVVVSRAATSESGADVQLESLPGGGTLARIRALVPVRVESQVLDEPPRVVLDLRRTAETAETLLPEEATPPESDEPPAMAALPEPAVTETRVVLEENADAGEDPVAALLAELQEMPAPSPPPEPPPASEPPARPEPAAPAAPPAPAQSPMPPVSGAPPAAIAGRFDGRSLVIGGVAGLVLGVASSLSSRSRAQAERRGAEPLEARESPAAELSPDASGEEESAAERATTARDTGPHPEPGLVRSDAAEEPAGRPLPGLSPGSDSLAADLLQMIQRLDDRTARGDELLSGLHERVEWLDRRTSAQAEELASQRMALARIQGALGHPPVRLATDRGKAIPERRLAKS